MIIFFKYIIPSRFSALTIYPFIFIRNKEDKANTILLNHEKIHLQQQKELLILFFYIAYLVCFLVKLIKEKNTYKAYQQLCFEQEAYQNEHDLNYIFNRKPYAFLNFCY